MIDIRLFGGLEVAEAGVPLRVGSVERPLLLLAYLVLHNDHPSARSHLAALLWPEATEIQARVNLRNLVHRLRLAIPAVAEYLTLADAEIRWRRTDQVEVDVWRVRDGIREGTRRSLEMACAAYRGALLPGCQEEWVVRAREELGEQYMQILERLADLAEGAREYDLAVRYAERLSQADPLNEEYLRRLMRAHALHGQSADVERVFQAGTEAVRRGLGCELSAVTMDLYRRLSSRPPRSRAKTRLDATADRTLHHQVGRVETELFVGRARELEAFRKWLLTDSERAAILTVHGPGGVGKSTLLRAFADMARRLGLRVALLDARTLAGSRQSLWAACGKETEREAIGYLNRVRPVLLFDTCEELGGLSHYLQEELLPCLDRRVRVIFAGRFSSQPMLSLDSPWRRLIHTMTLAAFTHQESMEYLHRRGVVDPALAAEMSEAAGGNPLALALAVDLTADLKVRDFRSALPHWRLTVHQLAAELTRDTKDAELRGLLEVASVLRQFDSSALAAVSGQPDAGQAFDRLARLSVVRPAEYGLSLHDDVRRILSEDLQWRDPDRWATLRLRALGHYRDRARRVARPEEHRWIWGEFLSLLSNALAQRVLFREVEPGLLWVEPGQRGDWPAVCEIWHQWVSQSLHAEPAPQLRQALECALRSRCFVLRVVRHRAHDILGFSGVLPLCQESLPILLMSPNTAALVRARWSQAELRALPARAEDAVAFHLRYAAYGTREAEAVRAVLAREVLMAIMNGGTYYVTTGLPDYKVLAEALGFRQLPEARHFSAGAQVPDDSYELDLTAIGFESWITQLVRGTAQAALEVGGR